MLAHGWLALVDRMKAPLGHVAVAHESVQSDAKSRQQGNVVAPDVVDELPEFAGKKGLPPYIYLVLYKVVPSPEPTLPHQNVLSPTSVL